MDITPVPSHGDEHWAPPHLVLARRVLAYAGRLFVTRNTVKSQVRSVYKKLGVSTRADAVACARAIGLR